MNKLITPKEASDILGVNLGSLSQMRFKGQGPTYTKVGRLVRYTEYAINDYLLQNQVVIPSDQELYPSEV